MTLIPDLSCFPLDAELMDAVRLMRRIRIETLERMVKTPAKTKEELVSRTLPYEEGSEGAIRETLLEKLHRLKSYEATDAIYLDEVVSYWEILNRSQRKTV